MRPEVRCHMMRPAQVVARRKKCPIAYIPLGTIEWHGPHNPLGADALQAEGLANLCARKGGGVAFPPVYYGESRVEQLIGRKPGDWAEISAFMETPVELAMPDQHPFGATEQVLAYQRLLLHILAEVESFGFEVGVLVAGHYPLIDHGRAAALLFNKRSLSGAPSGMLAWACIDFLFLRGRYKNAGDHGGPWETSHLMALHPQTVDLSRLPPRRTKRSRRSLPLDTRDSNAAFGRRILDEAAKAIVREAHHRLRNRQYYFQHGNTLDEGLWKKGPAEPIS